MPRHDDLSCRLDGSFDRIISLQEAEVVSSLSVDSWKRQHPDKVVELSKRRLGVRLGDALMLTNLPPKPT